MENPPQHPHEKQRPPRDDRERDSTAGTVPNGKRESAAASPLWAANKPAR